MLVLGPCFLFHFCFVGRVGLSSQCMPEHVPGPGSQSTIAQFLADPQQTDFFTLPLHSTVLCSLSCEVGFKGL